MPTSALSVSHCPHCYTPLVARDVTPCFDCGAFEGEIELALSGKHQYAEWRILGDIRLVLSDFCRIDAYSYNPAYFGFADYNRLKIALDQMEFVRSVDVHIGKDKYCPNCGRRLAFVQFLERIRNRNEESGEPE